MTDPDLPVDGGDANAWGSKLNNYLTFLNGRADTAEADIASAVTAAQSASTLAGTVNTALATKADSTGVYTKTAADARYVRTINSTTPDAGGNVIVAPTPGIRAITWDGITTQPLRADTSTDTTQPVHWYSPIAPTIGGAYAIDDLDVWFVTP